MGRLFSDIGGGLDNFYKLKLLLFFLFFLTSTSAFSATCMNGWSSPYAYCAVITPVGRGSIVATSDTAFKCNQLNSNGTTTTVATASCNQGWTFSAAQSACVGVWDAGHTTCVADPVCTSNQTLTNHVCVDNPDPVCTSNQTLTNHVCVDNPDPVCTSNQTLTNHICVDNPSSPPSGCAQVFVGSWAGLQPYITDTQFSTYQQTGVNGVGTPIYTAWHCPGGVPGGTCDAPKYLNSSGVCVDPKECVPPEVDNGFGICAVKECTGGKVNNVTTGQCQMPPVCGSTEVYYNPTNSCKSKELRCPGHSHANTANDQCLNDPPLTCPIGKHDDGTYTCIADDAKGCNSKETHGYIFGIAQCIPKPNLDTLQQQAQDAADAKKAAQASANETAAALIAAKAALDADPTNAAKQAAYDNAKSANDAAQSAAGEASDAAKDSTDKADTNALKDIADTVRAIDDRQKLADEVGFGDIPGAEEVETQTLSVVQGSHNVGGSCPSSLSASTSRGVFNISLQPVCDFASLLSPMVVSLAWLAAGFIVFGYKSE